MAKYNCILVDWDNTIVNSLPLWIKTYKILLKTYGISATKKEILKYAYGNVKGVLNFGIEDYITFNTRLFEMVEEHYPSIDLFPEVKSTLVNLYKNGKNICIVTSTKRCFIKRALEYHNLSSYISWVVGREDSIYHKPDPQPVMISITKLQCTQEEAIMVGDSSVDIIAGNRSGVDTVLFSPKKIPINTDYSPTYVIQNFAELNSIILAP